MIMKCHTRTATLSLVLGVALFLGLSASGAMGQRTTVRRNAQVAIGLDTNSVTKEELASQIRQQLGSRSISVSEREVQAAAGRALDLIGRTKDPEKGVIHIKTKKFTICASWGRDKDYCGKQ